MSNREHYPSGLTSFEVMAYRCPADLLAWVADGTLEPGDLAVAAEVLRKVPGSADVLLTLLQHPSAVVREGAVYGAEGHLDDERIPQRLQEMALNDSSRGVRCAAASAVDMEWVFGPQKINELTFFATEGGIGYRLTPKMCEALGLGGTVVLVSSWADKDTPALELFVWDGCGWSSGGILAALEAFKEPIEKWRREVERAQGGSPIKPWLRTDDMVTYIKEIEEVCRRHGCDPPGRGFLLEWLESMLSAANGVGVGVRRENGEEP